MEDNVDKVVNDYRIVLSGSEYTAPECRRFHLQGECTWMQPLAGSDPQRMTSSPIVSVEGDVVTTRSGSTYILGTAAEGYDSFAELREKHTGVPLT